MVFKDLPNGTYELGTVKKEDGSQVVVTVDLWPSMFFTFDIVDCEGNKTRVSTGSGSLSTFWPSVELVMGNMFVFVPSEE